MNKQEIKWNRETAEKICNWSYTLQYDLLQVRQYHTFYAQAIKDFRISMSKRNINGTISWSDMPSLENINKGEAYRDALIMRIRRFLKEPTSNQEVTLSSLIKMLLKNGISMKGIDEAFIGLNEKHKTFIEKLLHTADKRIAHYDYNALQEKLSLGESLIDNDWEGFFKDIEFIISKINRGINKAYDISRNNGGAIIDFEQYEL